MKLSIHKTKRGILRIRFRSSRFLLVLRFRKNLKRLY